MATEGELDALKEKVRGCPPEVLEASARRLEEVLPTELAALREDGQAAIPTVQFEEIASNGGALPEPVAKKVLKRGVLVVKGVLPPSEASEILSDLEAYMRANGEDPSDPGKTFYEVYWSRAQFRARSHPNLLSAQRALLGLWAARPDLDQAVDLSRPLMYIDRFRMRKPGGVFNLDPHLDSGSITRWTDPMYREAYSDIFCGRWEDYDPFLVGGRGQAVMDEHCSFFRAFQGWTSLSRAGPGEGTIRILPLLKEATAALLLRPLLKGVKGFPGYRPGKLFYASVDLHKDLLDSIITLPSVEPGDTVWWHPDVIHGVERCHKGSSTNTVLYIPVGPECPLNRLYVQRARNLFKKGLGPPDFSLKPENELHYVGRATWDDLSQEAKAMFGSDKL